MPTLVETSLKKTTVPVPDEPNPYLPDSPFYRCPNCGSKDTRKSYPRGLLDTIMIALNRSPYRCRRCHKRFIRKLKTREDWQEEQVAAEAAAAETAAENIAVAADAGALEQPAIEQPKAE